jgi:predicted component of type VI protein secretion system
MLMACAIFESSDASGVAPTGVVFATAKATSAPATVTRIADPRRARRRRVPIPPRITKEVSAPRRASKGASRSRRPDRTEVRDRLAKQALSCAGIIQLALAPNEIDNHSHDAQMKPTQLAARHSRDQPPAPSTL